MSMRLSSLVLLFSTCLLATTPPSASTFSITSPSAATVWNAGSVQSITWTLGGGPPDLPTARIRLSYQKLPDGRWDDIGEGPAGSLSFSWRIPADAVGDVRIRAALVLPQPIRVFSRNFRIVPADVRLPAASGGRLTSVSDYAIDSVSFADGRPLTAGLPYSRGGQNVCRLTVHTRWNRVAAAPGLHCYPTVTLFSQSGAVLLAPTTIPDSGPDGMSEVVGVFDLPRDWPSDRAYPVRVRLESPSAACDADAANNSRTVAIPLVVTGGTDLTVKVLDVKVEPQWAGVHLSGYNLAVTYEVTHAGAAPGVGEVPVAFYWHMTPGRTGAKMHETTVTFRQRGTVRHTARFFWGLPGAGVDVVVDPDNRIAEVREDNNRDDYPIRWEKGGE